MKKMVLIIGLLTLAGIALGLARNEKVTLWRFQTGLAQGGSLAPDAWATACVGWLIPDQPEGLGVGLNSYEPWCEAEDAATGLGVTVDHIVSQTSSQVCAALHNGDVSNAHDYILRCWGYRWWSEPS